MQNIPFGKFFDAQTEHALIGSLKLIKTYELDPYTRDKVYLFTSSTTNDTYIVVDTDHGPDWQQVTDWVREVMQDQAADLKEIPPKSPELYADPYYLFRIIS
jgi:hypothetical protein